MRATLFLFGALALSLPQSGSAALMGAGDIAFIGFNTEGTEDVSFVTLTDIDPNTSVFFNERNWNGSAFMGSEWVVEWSSGASLIAAGTVISFNNLKGPGQILSHGQFGDFSGTPDLSPSNEALWAYLGTDRDSPTAFLSVVANNVVGVTGFTTLADTGLTDGVNAQIIAGNEDIMAYVGPRAGQPAYSNYLALISNDANWLTQDTLGANDHGDGTAPDVPFDTTAFTDSSASASVPEPNALMLALSGMLAYAAKRSRRTLVRLTRFAASCSYASSSSNWFCSDSFRCRRVGE